MWPHFIRPLCVRPAANISHMVNIFPFTKFGGGLQSYMKLVMMQTTVLAKWNENYYKHTPNGSALSHEIWDSSRWWASGCLVSDSDSGTATIMKRTSSAATTVASATTRPSPYMLPRYAPIAGLVTKLAANVADTCTAFCHIYSQSSSRVVPANTL